MEQRLQEHLKRLGYRMTEPRRTVFAALQGHDPQTMNQLAAACPGVDRSTVYRTIELFENLGIAKRLQIGWKYKLELSEEYSHHHHHQTCLRCGRVVSFNESDQLTRELMRTTKQHDFLMQDHQLEIQGLCSRCRPVANPA